MSSVTTPKMTALRIPGWRSCGTRYPHLPEDPTGLSQIVSLGWTLRVTGPWVKVRCIVWCQA